MLQATTGGAATFAGNVTAPNISGTFAALQSLRDKAKHKLCRFQSLKTAIAEALANLDNYQTTSTTTPTVDSTDLIPDTWTQEQRMAAMSTNCPSTISNKSMKKKATEDQFNELHNLVTKEFLARIKSGEASTQDLKAACDWLHN